MKLVKSVPVLVAALALAVPAAARAGNYMSSTWNSRSEGSRGAGAYSVREAEGMIGPYGQPSAACRYQMAVASRAR